jgi:hypothetical protein
MAEKKKAGNGKKRKSKVKPDDNVMKYHLIEKYRQIVSKRYDYDEVKKIPGFPDTITRQMVDTLRKYFLENFYPETAQREKLDAAFAELENYVLHPAKVWDLLGNLASAILSFGLQFPAAIKAGFNSLEAYTSAKHFENLLTAAALEKGFTVPVSDKQFYECLIAIPQKDLHQFISELENLFESFTNTELLGKTISIMEDVLNKMKEKPDIYSASELEAIELGLDIMRKGYALFNQYDESMKKEMLLLISDSEKRFIDSLYNGEYEGN